MNSDVENASNADGKPTEAAAGGEGTDAAAAKPVRRRRTVKAAAEPTAESAGAGGEAAVAQAPEGEPSPAEPAKPARKRRTTKAADAVPEAVTAAAPSEPAAAHEPIRIPEHHPAVPMEMNPVAVATHHEAVPVDVPVSSAEVVTAGVSADRGNEGGAPGGEAGEGAGEGGPRSERSRRRNRRDRRRGRGGEGEALQAGEVAAGDEADEGDEATPAEPRPTLPPADVGETFAHVVSGDFDADGEAVPEPPEPHKRVLLPDPDAPKLHKVLAQAGIGSRRDMEQLIAEGKITVNGQPAHVGQRISFGDHIKVDGKPVKVRIVPPAPRIIAYHKPVGEVVTNDDPQHRPTVFRRLPRLPQGKWQSVGRLDLNTEGLLLFTNSGELANQLMHPRFGVEREYAVRVLGTLTEDDKYELLEGVTIDGQAASFKSIEDGGGEGANHWYRVVITEGRNREVRRMFEEVGLTVSRLIRIRYGTVVLPRGLKRGMWVDLSDEDVRAIRRLAGGGEGQARDDRGGRGGRNKNRTRNDRNERNDRGPRNGNVPPRGNRPPEQQRVDTGRERGEDQDVEDEDIDHSRIPNPLEQTFDKRFVQNPRTGVGGRGFRHGGGGFGSGGSAPAPKKGGGPREPDPLQTSVGYIGADAFHRKGNRGRGGGGGGGGNRGGGGGGFGGGGGRRGR